jgi:hypothetical protein
LFPLPRISPLKKFQVFKIKNKKLLLAPLWITFHAVLRIVIRDGEKTGSGPGIWDEHPRSFFRELRNILGLKILKLFDADPNPGSGIF